MKKLISLFLTLFVASSVWAYDFVYNGIYYNYVSQTENTVAVTYKDTKYNSYSGNVTIPSSVKDNRKTYSVTSIGEYAFYGCTGLTSITIPNSVTSIGGAAFYGCTGLTSVTIPNSVTSIEESAFKSCTGLTSVTIPNSVTSIGKSAFYGCTGLTSITISNSVTSIGEYAFEGCTGLTSITIPNSVTSIGYEAFNRCTGLTSVTIPNSVTEIGIATFKGCTGLTSITIPSSVTSIGKSAFYGCTGLTLVTIPNSVTTIGEDAFYDCNNLTSVTINGDLDVSNADLYITKDGIKYRILNGKEVEVASSYFYDENYNRISNYSGDFVIPASIMAGNTFSVIGIGDYAFSVSKGLSSITIPESVTNIGKSAFYGCTGLTSVTIPNSVTSIGDNAFEGCSNVNSITILASIASIGDYAFSGLGTLKSISIPEDFVIPCWKLLKDDIIYKVCGNRVTVIGGNNLKELVIPSAIIISSRVFPVSIIEQSAFLSNDNLKKITIGANCSIYSFAFTGCSRLAEVVCLSEDVPRADKNSFKNYNGYLYVPCEYLRYYKADNIFGQFANIECIQSEETELQKDDVEIVPEISNALFSMPKNESAKSYTLTIQNNGVTFCTLTFNAQGQLASIDFSTTKSYELKAGISAFQFTVTGLSSATKYGYSFKALSSSKSVLKEYTGSFTTKNEDGTGGSSSGGGEGTLAVDNISANNAVTIANNQILVNGEAPAFVVTVSGKKIANQNLKSGVYFVVVDGETVGVSVR